MPDNGHLDALLASLADSVGRLGDDIRSMDKVLRGNGGPGVLGQAHANAKDIASLRTDTAKEVVALRDEMERVWKALEKIGNSVDLIVNPGVALEATKVRWHVIGQVVVAVLAAAGVALDVFF